MKKTVLVTGAAEGTGYGIARRFAKEGMNVCLTSRSEEKAKAAAGRLMQEFPDIEALGFSLEKADEKRIEEILDSIEKKGFTLVNVVCNAANQGIGQNSLTVSFDDWCAVIQANVFMHFLLMRCAAKRMIASGTEGAMAVVGSNTMRRALPERSAYCTSKGALSSLVKGLAVDFAPYKIRVNYTAIGSIKTVRWDSLSEEVHEKRLERAPLRDVVLYEDVANAVYFLCSDQARLITGTDLYVDAGVDAAFPCGSDNG